jgi:hypothetical protein
MILESMYYHLEGTLSDVSKDTVTNPDAEVEVMLAVGLAPGKLPLRTVRVIWYSLHFWLSLKSVSLRMIG